MAQAEAGGGDTGPDLFDGGVDSFVRSCVVPKRANEKWYRKTREKQGKTRKNK